MRCFILNGSSVIDWATRRLGFKDGFYESAQEVAASPAGAHGVFFLPHLRGVISPKPDEKLRGAFLGLRELHQSRDMLRAVYEGLAYEFRLCMSQMQQLICISDASGIGGGFRNPVL